MKLSLKSFKLNSITIDDYKLIQWTHWIKLNSSNWMKLELMIKNWMKSELMIKIESS